MNIYPTHTGTSFTQALRQGLGLLYNLYQIHLLPVKKNLWNYACLFDKIMQKHVSSLFERPCKNFM